MRRTLCPNTQISEYRSPAHFLLQKFLVFVGKFFFKILENKLYRENFGKLFSLYRANDFDIIFFGVTPTFRWGWGVGWDKMLCTCFSPSRIPATTTRKGRWICTCRRLSATEFSNYYSSSPLNLQRSYWAEFQNWSFDTIFTTAVVQAAKRNQTPISFGRKWRGGASGRRDRGIKTSKCGKHPFSSRYKRGGGGEGPHFWDVISWQHVFCGTCHLWSNTSWHVPIERGMLSELQVPPYDFPTLILTTSFSPPPRPNPKIFYDEYNGNSSRETEGL